MKFNSNFRGKGLRYWIKEEWEIDFSVKTRRHIRYLTVTRTDVSVLLAVGIFLLVVLGFSYFHR